MNLRKATQRERKINKRKNGMVVDSRSVFTIQRLQKERAEKIREERKIKEESQEGE
jgi:hypothetical protein